VDIKTTLKATVAAGALFALAAPVGVAEAGSLSANNSKVDVTIGGRVHRALIHVDDGQHEETFHTSGITSDSEMWLAGKGKLTESVTMGAYLRWDIAKAADSWSFGSTTGEAANAAVANTNKYEYIYFKHKTMGTLSLGDMEPGADGTMDKRYAKTLVNQASAAAGGSQLTLSTGAFSGFTVGTFFTKIDPGDQIEKIRYDYSASGLSVGADIDAEGGGSFGAKYAGKMAGMDFFAAAGYSTRFSGTANTAKKGASVGVKHASGFNLSGNIGRSDVENTDIDPEWWRIIGGYDAKVNSLGTTSISVSYSESEDVSVKGNQGDATRVALVQSLDSVGARMGIEYTNLEVSNLAAQNFNDIDIILFETAFNF
jgi:hypothetical protein